MMATKTFYTASKGSALAEASDFENNLLIPPPRKSSSM